MFDFDTKLWTEISLNLPVNRIYYQFHMDENAMLSVITYSKIDERSDEVTELRTSLIRIPLKKADKLMTLCWFKVRECDFSAGFMSNFMFLIERINLLL